MTDRELLELAAKAAYNELRWDSAYGENPLYQKWKYIDNDWIEWNPLTNDGDALRLAVKLNLSADFFSGVIMVGYTPKNNDCNDIVELVGGDPYAATRRAIVRAAAEIGKGM